ncbi:diaminopimelate epimerase [Synechococcus sp. ATX 2A4]|uniref:diaminopimelate epimerase n=1 Tax=Synechococcus sp. ATX 2A4 TaxID=2823727 RepID=UPI0020CF1236|nr:diaminopimelate epimerase [Synechococcus sp. ATX 2A4]MCP9884082.1 diaminopimelate epimerase [Synechococcus sp. ATX 2A4]
MLAFSKYQGLGNDFLLLDGRNATTADFCFDLTPERVSLLCDRRFGVGGDGVILALPPEQDGELRMRIFNADGTEPEMCGNGIRCLARFLADSDGDAPGRRWMVETLAGLIVPELLADGSVRVDMGTPFLVPEQVPTTLEIGPSGLPQGELSVAGESFAVAAAGMGNPHVVLPVAAVQEVDLERLGPLLERHPAFPARTNVHFVEALSPSHLVMRVWERGAGPTLACGTGACATLVASHRLGLCERSARVDLPGGTLWIDWDTSSDHLFMSGPAEPVFDGVLAPELFGDLPPGASQPADAPEERSGSIEPNASIAPSDNATSVGAADDLPAAVADPTVNCAVECTNGCQQPDDCPNAALRARVDALLNSRSLDDLVTLASNSLEARTRQRLEREG